MINKIFKNKNLLKSSFIIVSSLFLPLSVFAQNTSGVRLVLVGAKVTCTASTAIEKMLCTVQGLLNSIVPVLIALGVVYFVWGVVQYVIGGGEEAKKKGRDHIIYGIIGFAVIVGLWGLVTLVTTTLLPDSGSVTIPILVPTTSTAVSGATCELAPKVQGLLNYGTCLIQNSVIPLMFALAIAYFIWGVLQFIMGSSEEAKRTQGKTHMIWGIIALAVMLGVWSLVGIVGGSLNLNTTILPAVKP